MEKVFVNYKNGLSDQWKSFDQPLYLKHGGFYGYLVLMNTRIYFMYHVDYDGSIETEVDDVTDCFEIKIEK